MTGQSLGFATDAGCGCEVAYHVRGEADFACEFQHTGGVEVPIEPDERSPVADVSAVPADRVVECAGEERGDDVPVLANEEAKVIVFHLPIGMAELDRCPVLEVAGDRALEVDFDLSATLGVVEIGNPWAVDIESKPGASSVQEEGAFAWSSAEGTQTV